MTNAQRKNPAAVELGRLGGRMKKNYSPEELEKRKQRLAEARKKRWLPKKQEENK